MLSEQQQRHSPDELRARLATVPRIALASLPTPLEPLPRLTSELGGPTLWVKRDDMTGLAFGGNKTRLLEFVLGDVMQRNPEVIVTGASIQSNWCRQAAAAAARLGIPIVLVLRRTERTGIQGNVLLDYWLGAEVRFVDTADRREVDSHVAAVVAELRAKGVRAESFSSYTGLAALGYLNMAAELDEQCAAKGIEPTRIWLSASGATLGGLALGRQALGWRAAITGIEPITWPHATTPEIAARTGNEASELLGLPIELVPAEIDSRAGFIGPGYQMASREGLDAMVRAARADALLLDPSYTGKAMAALMAAVAAGELTERDTVVFVHTGGLPSVFAYADVIREAVGAPASSVDPSRA